MNSGNLKTNKMEMRRNGLYLAYTLFFHVLLIAMFQSTVLSVAGVGDTLSSGAFLTGNQTIISENGTFELGFFSPNGTNNWYIGIWYAKILLDNIVWVANRETPLRGGPGILKLSMEGDLGLFDEEGRSFWSVNVTTKKESKAVLLDSGNFVLVADSNDKLSDPVWQSFDHPVHTFLPGMRFGGRQKLISWKNSLDPAPGLFSLHTDPSGEKQFFLTWNDSVTYWKSGVWDGETFGNIPEMAMIKGYDNFTVESVNGSLVYMRYVPLPSRHMVQRNDLVNSGTSQSAMLDGNKWTMFWSKPSEQCQVYGVCGAFGVCNSDNIQLCSCPRGFEPRDYHFWRSREWWASGCVRQSPLSCDATDGFIDVSVTLSAADDGSSFTAPAQSDCENACLVNCSCTAFSFNPPSGTCKIWLGDLQSLHVSPSQSSANVLIRVAAAALNAAERASPSSKRKIITIVGPVVGAVVALAVAFGVIFRISLLRKDRLRVMERYADSLEHSFLCMFSYKELKIATRNFRSKLGSGGFGAVFKGSLPDGTLVAVKKMNGSKQDEKQFRAEISSLGNIQHVNLVRLRGFCAEGSKRLLVYDYMPKGSLNSILFKRKSKSEGEALDWKTRFQIALGTARGLLYLHEQCRDCIIHSDVKPENILLDNNFSPKLGDFGLAKLVGRDFSHVLTTTRGTRGYLAPEWISGLPITPKVDVYSYGMTLLEIISGRRSLDTNVQDSSKYYFPPWARTQISQGNIISVVEESLAAEVDIEEVKRACVVGLLCIENNEDLRPTMTQVVQMLEGKIELQFPPIQNPGLMNGQADQSNNSSNESSYYIF